jgi:citrate lyase subunit beta-like protein
MINKSHTTEADTIIYDLEDSVAPSQKHIARMNLVNFLVGIMNSEYAFPIHRVAIRINDLTSPHFADDVQAIKSLGPYIAPTIVVPKVEGPEVIGILSDQNTDDPPWNVVASIESANALLSMDTIVAHEFPKADIVALLVSLFMLSWLRAS